MNISTEHISQCNQSEPLADASGRIVDMMNEDGSARALHKSWFMYTLAFTPYTLLSLDRFLNNF